MLASSAVSISTTLLVLAFLAQAPGPPPPQAPADASASVTVVAQDASSAAPFEGASITIPSLKPPPREFKASTFANGTVQFTGLIPATYDVVAAAPDLLPGESVIAEQRRPVTL